MLEKVDQIFRKWMVAPFSKFWFLSYYRKTPSLRSFNLKPTEKAHVPVKNVTREF